MYIYVIEMLVKDEIVTSHIFLTQAHAYRKFFDMWTCYYGSGSVKKMWLIERKIDDKTGEFTERELDKTDS